MQRVNLGRALLLAAALEVLLGVTNAGITWVSKDRHGLTLWTVGVAGAVAIALIKTLVEAFGKESVPERAAAAPGYGYDPRLGPAPYGQPGYMPPAASTRKSGMSVVAAIVVLLVVAGGGGYALTLGFRQLFTSVVGLADPASIARAETGTDRLKRSASATSGPLRLTVEQGGVHRALDQGPHPRPEQRAGIAVAARLPELRVDRGRRDDAGGRPRCQPMGGGGAARRCNLR